MKIDINGTIRDMTEEELKEYEEAVASAPVSPNTLDEKVDTLLQMVDNLTKMLQGQSET